MKDVFYVIMAVIAGRLIGDNLPHLHYKKLLAGYSKHILPTLLTAYLGSST